MTPLDLERRRDWLKARQSGIGGTDIASICGVGFLSAEEVYAEKIAPEPVDRTPSPIMLMGLATEEHNATLYRQRTGARLLTPGFDLTRSDREPWRFATFDRLRLDSPELGAGRPVELKYAGPFFGNDWGEDGSDEVRDGYIVQATWQAGILLDNGHAIEGTDVSALAGSGEHRIYPIRFDAALAELLRTIAAQFWGLVESRLGAANWTSPLLPEVFSRLSAIRPDTAIPLDHEALELADAYQRARDDAKFAEDRAAAIKERLCELLGGAEVGVLPDGRRVRQKVVARNAYSVEAGSYVDFRILAARKPRNPTEDNYVIRGS